MLFNSATFIFLFLPVMILLHTLALRFLSHKHAMAVLLLGSLFFYGYWDVRFLPLLVLSIAINFVIASQIMTHRDGVLRLAWLTGGISLNLAALFYFKYSLFMAEVLYQATDYALPLGDVVLPIGLSFFTFQQIAYLVDVHEHKTADHSFLRYALFVSFFPQLIAGPIVHHGEMMPQFRHPGLSRLVENLAIGFTIFSIGLAKKVIIADTMASWSTPLFDLAAAGETITFFEAWGACLSYTLQIYFDFSGYSEMAIGLGRMFGIVLPANFSSPYKSASVIEFWKRWHMTLSRFLRDYLYIPLGGNRRGPLRRYINIIVTMVLGGLWHGAGWTFILWGALHACAITVNAIWRSHGFKRPLPPLVGWMLTFTFVAIAWVPFRAPDVSTTFTIWSAMAGLSSVHVPVALQFWLSAHPELTSALSIKAVGIQVLDSEWALMTAIALWIALIMPNTQTFMKNIGPILTTRGYPLSGKPVVNALERIRWRPSLGYAALTAVIFVCALAWGNDVSEFIYFQF